MCYAICHLQIHMMYPNAQKTEKLPICSSAQMGGKPQVNNKITTPFFYVNNFLHLFF